MAQLVHHWHKLRKHSPAAAGRLSGQRNRRGHVKARKTGTRRGFARGKRAVRRVVLGARGLERLEDLARRVAGAGGGVAEFTDCPNCLPIVNAPP